jgi:hypothetical protein
MRRRAVPALIASFAVGLGLWRRSRRRAAAPSANAGAISVPTGDRAISPNPQVEPERSSDTRRFLSIPWSPHPDPPQAGSTELRIHCTLTSEGMELARVDVRETASQVFVTVLAQWAPEDPHPAAHAGTAPTGRKREATATLREPLGDRALVHAPHDAPPR